MPAQPVSPDLAAQILGERIIAGGELVDGDTTAAAQRITAEAERDAAPDHRQGDETEHATCVRADWAALHTSWPDWFRP